MHSVAIFESLPVKQRGFFVAIKYLHSIMWINRHLIWIFYRSIIVLNFAFSFGVVVLLLLAGWSFVMVATLIKLMAYGAIIGYKYTMAQKEFYYYRNAGVSINRLYFYTFVIDFFLYLVIVIIYYFLK